MHPPPNSHAPLLSPNSALALHAELYPQSAAANWCTENTVSSGSSEGKCLGFCSGAFLNRKMNSCSVGEGRSRSCISPAGHLTFEASPETGGEPASLAVVILPHLSSQHASRKPRALPSAWLANHLPFLDSTHSQSTVSFDSDSGSL